MNQNKMSSPFVAYLKKGTTIITEVLPYASLNVENCCEKTVCIGPQRDDRSSKQKTKCKNWFYFLRSLY